MADASIKSQLTLCNMFILQHIHCSMYT